MHDHAKYRWLLQLDGYSASYRMNLLMAANSVIAKSKCAFVHFSVCIIGALPAC